MPIISENDQEIILEEKKFRELQKPIISYMCNLLEHMIRALVVPEKTTTSWEKTINDSIISIEKCTANSNTRIKLKNYIIENSSYIYNEVIRRIVAKPNIDKINVRSKATTVTLQSILSDNDKTILNYRYIMDFKDKYVDPYKNNNLYK